MLHDRRKDEYPIPLCKQHPLSEQRQVLFPRLLELRPILPFTKTPHLPEQQSVMFQANFGL